MKPTIIILLAFIFLNSCKNSEDSKNESSAIQDSIANAKTVNVENMKSEVISENNSSIAENSQDDWYWKNTMMSKNNKFENWDGGSAKLLMSYKSIGNGSEPKIIHVGSVNSEGLVQINLPEVITTETSLDYIGNLVFFDFQDIGALRYDNGKVGSFSRTSLQVEQHDKIIGNITMGNSVRVTYNLTNQSTLTMGDEGYILYWVYVDEACKMQGTENRKDKVRRDGTNTIDAATEVVYDLQLKQGWNFVKTEVIGSYDLDHERGLNASWFKKHKHTVVPEIPSDAVYFFRKNNY
ncbi:MAG: hypothetical protein K8F54_11630 [Altibacter sp.]|uniref:hypothetical protein n=1 Tax=Altibacter sp. TaxID=2024823 RepID=UPI001DF09ACF|nr:hypothetical protein [Altibacter sp.]MBZ0328250.1 hypothetical protein [Altibacter sp.]